MASVMTLDGPRGLAGNPVGDWILGRGLVVGSLLTLATSMAVGGALSAGAIWAINRAKKAAGRPALSGPSSRRRQRRKRRR